MAANIPLTPEEQAAYDEYVLANPNSGKTILEGMSPAALRAFLAERISANGPQQIVAPVYGGNTPPIGQDTTFSQQPYGVSGNRQALKATGLPVAGSYTGFRLPPLSNTVDRMKPIDPRYFEGDEDLLNGLSRTDVMTIQTGMKQAGILGKFRLGVVDEATSNAFKEVLGQANKVGGDYMQGLKVLQQAGPASGNGIGGSGLAARVSNPDDLGKVIDNSAGLVLGRKVDPAMKQRLVQAYQMLERQNQAPNAGVFAEKQIGQQNSAEADAYKFSQFAETILGGQGG